MNASDIAKQLGKRGGAATKRKYGRKHFSEAGKKGMARRWGQLRQPKDLERR